jgi:hypothetical protein
MVAGTLAEGVAETLLAPVMPMRTGLRSELGMNV